MSIIKVKQADSVQYSGEIAWIFMAVSILAYDLFAIRTRKCETMSSAIWRSLSHPVKAPIALSAWAILTHHLFANKSARSSIILLKNMFNYIGEINYD